jgi:methylmalonyl-CoA mutase
MQEAGANQALELAFTLADGMEYVKTALASGLDVDEFAGRLSFFLGDRHELLSRDRQDARRAAPVVEDHDRLRRRRIRSSLMLRTHCQTSGWSR